MGTQHSNWLYFVYGYTFSLIEVINNITVSNINWKYSKGESVPSYPHIIKPSLVPNTFLAPDLSTVRVLCILGIIISFFSWFTGPKSNTESSPSGVRNDPASKNHRSHFSRDYRSRPQLCYGRGCNSRVRSHYTRPYSSTEKKKKKDSHMGEINYTQNKNTETP